MTMTMAMEYEAVGQWKYEEMEMKCENEYETVKR
jgi:hypothetical protein